jgi:glutamate carboxypeptidase
MTATLPTPKHVDEIDGPALYDWVSTHRDHLVQDVRTYVEHETPSDDVALLASGLAYVEQWVGGRLGRPSVRVEHTSERYGDVLVLDYPGVGRDTLTLLCHYDTVWSAGTLDDWPVGIDGDTITGPGVFDMKAGLVQAVWALRALDAMSMPRPPVRLVLTGDEEIGSPFSRPVIETACADTSAVLVFEASADGALKTERSGVGLFDVSVVGVESHAGLDPRAGVSAVDEIARVTRTLHDTADLDRGTSVNVGVLRGGTRPNVVAGVAAASVDVRVTSVEEQQRVDRAMQALRPHHDQARLSVTGGWNRPVMTRTPGVAALFDLARAAAVQLGVDLREKAVGGASDGNFAAALGIPVLDGLGAVGAGAHARHEHVTVSGMLERTAIAAAVMSAFARE